MGYGEELHWRNLHGLPLWRSCIVPRSSLPFVIMLQNNPLRLMTKLARYFYNERGWELIWTPPYCPDLQPIEKLWAFIKNRVGANWEVAHVQ